MKKIWKNITKIKWLNLLLLTIVSLTAGIHLLLFPETVNHWIIRGVGFLWIMEGIIYFMDFLVNKKVRQFFCKHNYRIPKEYDDYKERNKLVSELKKGESIAFSRIHRCTKCEKEIMIGSGMIC